MSRVDHTPKQANAVCVGGGGYQQGEDLEGATGVLQHLSFTVFSLDYHTVCQRQRRLVVWPTYPT